MVMLNLKEGMDVKVIFFLKPSLEIPFLKYLFHSINVGYGYNYFNGFDCNNDPVLESKFKQFVIQRQSGNCPARLNRSSLIDTC